MWDSSLILLLIRIKVRIKLKKYFGMIHAVISLIQCSTFVWLSSVMDNDNYLHQLFATRTKCVVETKIIFVFCSLNS